MTTTIAHYNLLDRIGDGGIGELYRARDTKVGRTVALKLVSPAIAVGPRAPAAPARGRARRRRAVASEHRDALGRRRVGGAHVPRLRVRRRPQPARGVRRRADESAARARPRRPDRRRRRRRACRTASSTATCAPTPSSSPRRGTPRCSTSAWRRGPGGARSARPPRRTPIRCRRNPPPCSATCRPSRRSAATSIARTDVFSIGALTYEMVTGRNPFVAPTAAATVMNVIQGKFTPASEVNPAVSAGARRHSRPRAHARSRPAAAERRGPRGGAAQRRRGARRPHRRRRVAIGDPADRRCRGSQRHRRAGRRARRRRGRRRRASGGGSVADFGDLRDLVIW